jgi:Tol biopolymer transport system component/predicted Ser/Thr protein kinase
MGLSTGTRLGPYEILSPLGAGGMGEVWKARDTRVDRQVAIKILPEDFLEGEEGGDRRERFEREAKLLASLNHPNVAVLYSFEEFLGRHLLTMELLEGESLRGKLGASLPPRRAVEIAAQVAQGLAAAHEKGIVHRDLKPENLFLTSDGRVKILDFGVAKLTRPAVSPDSQTEAPTATRATEAGVVLGTVGYMSPEQILGKTIDPRSDVFSLGVVLYEMLAGERPFRGETAPATMAAILRDEPPDLAATDPGLSPALSRIVRHCLEKEPDQRFQSARDVAFDLASALDLPSGRARGAAAERRARRPALRAAAFLAMGLALGTGLAWVLRPASTVPVRVRPLTFSGRDGEPSASPDGHTVAFASARDGVSRIWVQQLAGAEAPLTSGPDRRPRFSPDGTAVLFLRREGDRLTAYRVPLLGGEPRKVLEDVSEADWSPDGQRIAFLRSRAVSSRMEWTLGTAGVQGGKETVLLTVRDFVLLHARWSPDGRTIAVIKSVVIGFAPGDVILLVNEAGGAVRTLAPARTDRPLCGLAWSGTGAALVFAQTDSATGDSSGALARVILKSVRSGRERTLFWASNLFPTIGGSKQYASFDVLGPGRLVFDEMPQRMNLREVTLGSPPRAERILSAGSSRDRQPTVSPDGEWLLFSSNRSGNLDLWTFSLRTGALRQITDDPAQDWDPAFTPDGKHILWSSDRGGNLEVWIANSDGSGARQLSRDGSDAENPTATPDGSWITYASGNPAKNGIWKVRADGSSPVRLIPGSFSNAEVSPDGRFATLLSLDRFKSTTTIRVAELETGRLVPFEIPVPYQVGPEASRILIGRSRWLPDGKAIAWVGEDENGLTGIFAQDFVPGRDTSSTRRKLAGFARDYVSESFAISPDGKRLILSTLMRSGRLMIAEGVPGVEPPVRPARNP